MQFSENTLRVLKDSGWFEDRKINTSEYKISLEENGLKFFDKAENFLEKYGGLKINFSLKWQYELAVADKLENAKEFGKKSFHFDVLEAIGMVDYIREPLEEFKREINLELSIIGECNNGLMTMLMAEDGTIYGYQDMEFIKLGRNGEEYIEKTCCEAQPV
jgi:hypothetical protein